MTNTDQDLSNLMRSKSGARWGNKFGMILLPVSYHRSNCSDPLQHVKRAKAMIDRKKQSLEAHFSYKIGDLVMSILGPKVHFLPSCLAYMGKNLKTPTISNLVVSCEVMLLFIYCSMLAC